jgi:hypothetical protein
MIDNNEFPEQLEDEDFEKEKNEKKRLKEEKKQAKKQLKKKEKNDNDIDNDIGISDDEAGIKDDIKSTENKKRKLKKYIPIILVVIIVLLVIAGIVVYVKNGENGTFNNKPESVIDNFCAYINSGDSKKALEYVDFKSYYILYTLDVEDYTKFDETYSEFDESSEDYQYFVDTIDECKNIDSDVYTEILEDYKISLGSVQSVTRIQDTEDLYLIKADLEFSYNGQEESETCSIYVNKIDGQYKIVYGDLADFSLSLLQSVYYITNYSY